MNARHIFLGTLLAAGLTLPAASFAQLTPRTPPTLSGVGQARKTVNDAELALKKAQAGLLAVKKKIVAKFEKTPEFEKAKDESAKADGAYQSAVRPVVEKVHASAAYKAADAKKQAAAEKFTALQAEKGVRQSDIDNVATDIATQGDALNKMEREAIEGDTKVADAKAKRDEASKALRELQQQEDDLVKADPEYQQALPAVDQAEQQLVSARQAMAAAAKSESDARIAKEKAQAQSHSGSSGGSHH